LEGILEILFHLGKNLGNVIFSYFIVQRACVISQWIADWLIQQNLLNYKIKELKDYEENEK
jgi:hypothetical protein